MAIIICANLGLLSILNYDKERILALTTLRSIVQTSTDLKNQQLDDGFVKNNLLGTSVSSKYYIPDYLINSKSKTYQYDPRLTVGIYLNHITSEFQKANDLSKFKVPFSWYDWTDLGTHLNKLINLPQKFKPDCSYVCTNYFNKQLQRELEEKIRGTFTEKEEIDPDTGAPIKKKPARRRNSKYQNQKYNYCKDDDSDTQPGFRIFKNHLKSKPDVKNLQSKSYLYSEASAPISITFLTKKGNLQVETIPNEGKENKQEYGLLNNNLISKYVSSFKTTKDTKEDIYVDASEEVKNLYDVISLNYSPLPLDNYSIELEQSQFEFNGPEYLKTTTPSNTHEKNFHNSIKNSLATKELLIEKYFEEVLLSRTMNNMYGGHFDWRFFSGDVIPDERQAVLSRLLQNWFKLTTNAGLHSWIGHGNLLAYSFNGLNFPWDDDIDVQMPFKDFAMFAEKFNGTLVVEDPEEGFGRYYVDVTSSLTHRLKGNNNNHIDARFVDIDTGLFIDITALAVSHSDTSMRFKDRYEKLIKQGEEVKYRDPNYIEGVHDDVSRQDMTRLSRENLPLYKQLRQFERETKSNKGKLLKDKTPEQRYDINYKLQTFNCRNDHFVSLDEISPLKRSFFEKIPVFVPNNVSAILLDEYKPQRKLAAKFRGFTYLPQIRLWVPDKSLSATINDSDKRKNLNLLTEEDIISLLEDETVLVEYYKTFDATLIREKEREIQDDNSIENKDELLSKLIIGKSFPSMRKDVFISRLENAYIKEHEITFNKEFLKKKMVEQLRIEYSKEIDYNIIGSGKSQDINFNSIGKSFKDYIKAAQLANYEPDFELIKQELQEEIDKSRNNIERRKKEAELSEFLDKEMKEKFNDKIPKPKLMMKGEVENIMERPKNKPMDQEEDPGVVEEGHDQIEDVNEEQEEKRVDKNLNEAIV